MHINREKTLYELLSRKFPKTEKIKLSYTFLPNEIKDNNATVNYTSTGDIWFIRLPVNDKEIFYYFGVSTRKNKDIFLRFIFKVNDGYFKYLEKFFEYDDIAFEVKINNDFNFIKRNFDLVKINDNQIRYFIKLCKINSDNFLLNIRKLIKQIEFDLDINNDILIINNAVEYRRRVKSPKINSNRVVQKSHEKKQSKPKNSPVKRNYSNSSRKQKFNPPNINQNSFSKPSVNQEKTIVNNRAVNSSNESLSVDVPKDQIEYYSEIVYAINEGYKYIILESNDDKSDLIKSLTEKYQNSLILTSNEYSGDNPLKNHNLDVYKYDEFVNDYDTYFNYEKKDLLILDEAHRIEEVIANCSSYDIFLSNYKEEFLDNFSADITKLDEKGHETWLEFINYLSLDNLKVNKIIECIKNTPQNWICNYDDFDNVVSLQPLDISNFVNEYFLDNATVCIFMSSSILDYKMFSKELGLEVSDVKFIHKDLPFNSTENKIYTRTSFDMSNEYLYEISKYLIQAINIILEEHKHEKGIIHVPNSTLRNFILNNIKSNRLISHSNNDFDFKVQKFKKSKNNVLVSNVIDSVEFPKDHCRFQIIIKQPTNLLDSRAKKKNKLESNWYDYKTAVNVVQLLERSIKSTDDYCVNYMLDEKFSLFISNDITKNKYIPQNILNRIVDFDITDYEMISNQINKQFGVYYLYDYLPKTRKKDKSKKYNMRTKRISERIRRYKDYDKQYPNLLKEDFNFFNDKLIETIAEFSNNIIGDEINKIALVAVPSSTINRDSTATMRESINAIENFYNSNLEFKEIINCSDLLYRVSDVKPSHLKGRRTSYIEHMNSIKCRENEILNMNDVSFIILDDITTRGTILNACEDKLIENGVNRANIYKFVIGKTVGFDD